MISYSFIVYVSNSNQKQACNEPTYINYEEPEEGTYVEPQQSNIITCVFRGGAQRQHLRIISYMILGLKQIACAIASLILHFTLHIK